MVKVSDFTANYLLRMLQEPLPTSEHYIYPAVDMLLSEIYPHKMSIIKPQPPIMSSRTSPLSSSDESEGSPLPSKSSHGLGKSSPSCGARPSHTRFVSTNSSGVPYGTSRQVVPDFSVSVVDEQNLDKPFLVVEIKLRASCNLGKAQRQLSNYLELMLIHGSVDEIYGMLLHGTQVEIYHLRKGGEDTAKRLPRFPRSFALTDRDQLTVLQGALAGIGKRFLGPEPSTAPSLGCCEAWLHERLDSLGSLRWEGQAHGLIRALLRSYYWLSASSLSELKRQLLRRKAPVESGVESGGSTQIQFVLMPQLLFQPNAADNSTEAKGTDPYGCTVLQELVAGHFKVDFGVCIEYPERRIFRPFLLVELKRDNTDELVNQAFEQLRAYAEMAANKLPEDERDTGSVFGLTICGKWVYSYKLREAQSPGAARNLDIYESSCTLGTPQCDKILRNLVQESLLTFERRNA